MTKLRIHLLGPFEIFRNGQPLTNQDWQSQQTRAVCKILCARYGQVISSDQIIDILWPDEDPETARRRLHVRISQLRRALGGGKSLVQTVDGGYIFVLGGQCWLDVDEFQRAVVEGQHQVRAGKQLEAIQTFEQAREWYRGDFLVEDLYADWTFSTREFFQERFLSLLTELSETYARQGRYRLAISRCQEALNRDPLRETIYVRLMLYHYFAGERSQSLRLFERCKKELAAELGVEPLENTVKIAAQIQGGTLWANTDVPRYPPPIYEGRLFEVPYNLSETPLVGREREYAWLVEQWKNPESRMILVEGLAGIGKTRLADAFLGYLAANQVQVLRTRIAPGEHSPFAPLIAVLQPLIHLENLERLSRPRLAALALLFPEIENRVSGLPEISELPAAAERERLYDAVTALVSSSISNPTLLFIDDANRIGQVACETLARLSGFLKVMVSYRPEEISSDHPLRTVIRNRDSGMALLQLETLQRADIYELIQRLAHNSLAEVGDEIARQTSGHPLYLVTLLQHMFDEGQIYVDESGGWQMVHHEKPSLPPTIRKTIEARLQGLDRSQRCVFDLAAVMGGEFDFGVLQAASQQAEETLLVILDRLIDLALVIEPRRSGQSEFAIAHDRYTEVAYDVLPQVRRKHYHHQVAKAIESQFAAALAPYYPTLADHYGKAQVPERERYYAILAGEQAAVQFANSTAQRYLSRALELTPAADFDTRLRVLLAREKIYDLLGDRENQKSDLDDLIRLMDQFKDSEQAEILLRKAAYDWILGDDISAFENLEKSIFLAQSCGATGTEAASLLLLGRGAKDQAIARKHLERARSLAQQDRLRAMEGDIVRCLGNACFWQNNYLKSRTYFEEALAIHREVGDLRGELSACNNLGLLSQNLGELHHAVDFYQKGLEISQKIGDRLAEGVLLANLGHLNVALGKFQPAEVLLKRAWQIRDEINNEEGVGLILPTLGDALRRQGKYAEAKKLLERSLEINLRIEHSQQQCLSLDGLSQLHSELGDYGSALAYYEKALAVLKDEQSPNRVRAVANGSLLHHLMGDHLKALEIGEQALKFSAALPQIRAVAFKNLGHVLAALGKYEQAQENYQQALELYLELMQEQLKPEPLAGLVDLALQRGSDLQALSYVEEILPTLQETPLIGQDQPFWIYLICCRALKKSGDPRSAEILERARDLLKKRAAAIDDDLLRRTYLENVKANREIIHLFETRN